MPLAQDDFDKEKFSDLFKQLIFIESAQKELKKNLMDMLSSFSKALFEKPECISIDTAAQKVCEMVVSLIEAGSQRAVWSAVEIADLFHQAINKGKKLKQELYGPSSERLFPLEYDLTEDERARTTEESRQEVELVKAHTRKKRKKRDSILDGLPEEVIDIYPEDPDFLIHRDEYIEVKPQVEVEIEYQPAVLRKIKTIRHSYIRTDENGETHYICGKNPKPKLIPGSYVSPSLLSHFAYSKVLLGIPLYRLELDFNRKGYMVSRQMISDWLILIAERYLGSIADEMLREFQQQARVHIDETPLRVIQNRKKGGNKEGTVFVGRSGPYEEHQMACYAYEPNKKQEAFFTLLPQEYSGIIVCDALNQHLAYDQATIACCMAHARRKFTDDLKPRKDYQTWQKLKTPEERERYLDSLPNPSLRRALTVIDLFARLYRIDSISKELNESPEQVLARRQQQSLPVFQALVCEIQELESGTFKKHDFNGASSYFMNHREELARFLEDPLLPLDNNGCEQMVKTFVMARKNFLFSNTDRGARAMMVYFTLLQSAVLNGLNPERYLTYVLEKMRSMKQTEENLRTLFPYSGRFPEELYITKR